MKTKKLSKSKSAMSSSKRQVAICLSRRKIVPAAQRYLASKSSTKSTANSTTQPTKPKQTRRREKNLDPCPPETPLPPCRVCDNLASGYHYGVNSCEACKVVDRILRSIDHLCETIAQTYYFFCYSQAVLFQRKRQLVHLNEFR